MRPRVFPAEDVGEDQIVTGDLEASMRPRVFPAEDAGRVARHLRPVRGLQ